MRVRKNREPAAEAPRPYGVSGYPPGTDGLEVVPQPTIARRGRRAVGWIGGLRVIEAVERAPEGMAVRMALPKAVPYDRIRWGIYAAARLRRVPVSIARQGEFVHIWRLGWRNLEA